MKLNPLPNIAPPGYPRRPFGALGRWARRAATAAGASLLLSVSGCYGTAEWQEIEDRIDETDDADPADPNVLVPLPEIEPIVVEPDPDPLPPVPMACEVEYRLSGMMAPTSYFSCDPDAGPSFEAPLYLGAAQLCGEEPAWARFTVAEAMTGRVTINAQNTLLTLLDPAGGVVAEIGPGPACVELEMEPGIWTMRADAVDPTMYPNEYFEFYVDSLELDEPLAS